MIILTVLLVLSIAILYVIRKIKKYIKTSIVVLSKEILDKAIQENKNLCEKPNETNDSVERIKMRVDGHTLYITNDGSDA